VPAGNPHEYAVEAEANLEKLATELARAGADDQTVAAVEQMADVTRKIVKALGAGQADTGDGEPPAPEPEPEPQNFDEAATALHQETSAPRSEY
jgi:hypothetical protein